MLPEITTEELSAALDGIAKEVLNEAGIRRPPVDAVALARTLGITVAVDNHQKTRAKYVRLKGYRDSRPQATILLRFEPRRERRHWAVAHEIGEHVAWRVFVALGVDPREARPNCREMVANQMAGRLLLPAGWFAEDAASHGWDVLALKRRYRTASHELIARRMLEFPPPVIISIFDHRQLAFRRSNVPGSVPPPCSVEMACWQTVHRCNEPHQALDGLCSVQGWPVHEDGWQREILRREVELEVHECW